MASSELSTGTHLGAWKIVRTLGRGGMGEVYEAQNTLSGTHRALKRIRPELVSTTDSRDRFLREVALSQRVRHPNIVECFDPFLVDMHVILPMELLVGETLAARLSRGSMSEKEAVELVTALAQGAGALHREGLAHRDLKPGNVFLARGPGGRTTPKILDMGATHEVLERRMTQAGFALGTMAYMAPEQARGEPVLDARVDVWSLGVLLYVCLTGRRPLENDEQGSILEKLANGRAIPSPSARGVEVSAELESVVMRALSARREDRYEDGATLARALEASRSGADATASPDLLDDPTAVSPAVSAPAAPPPTPPVRASSPPRVPLVLEPPKRLEVELDRSALRVSRPSTPPPAPAPPRVAKPVSSSAPSWARVGGGLLALCLITLGLFTIGPIRTAILAALGWLGLFVTRRVLASRTER